MLLLSSADFLSKLTFSKDSFRNTIRASNGLDSDKDRCSVGPDLDPNHLKRLSADDNGHPGDFLPFSLGTTTTYKKP